MTSFNYIWKIENLSKCLQSPTTTSPVFRGAGYNWSLTLTSKDASGVDKEYLALKLMASDVEIVPRAYHNNSILTRASYDACIIDTDGYKAKRATDHDHFHNFTPSIGVCYDKFLQRDELLDERHELLPNDTLTIQCKIRVLACNDVHPTDCASMPIPWVPSCRLKQDLKAILGEGLFSDTTLCIQGRDFPVHRAILAGQSTVFRAMFEHDMKESNERRVVIEDMHADTASELLMFLYTGNAPNIAVEAAELMAAAEKYDIPRLKAACEYQLSQKLIGLQTTNENSIDEAIDLLSDADTYNATQLKKSALFWISRRLKDAMKLDRWSVLVHEKPHLVEELLKVVADYVGDLSTKPCDTDAKRQRSE